MTILLPVIAMFTIGFGEMIASGTTKQARPHEVTSMMFLAGTLGTVVAAFFWRGEPTTRDLVFGLLGGVANGIGILLLYAAYSRGSLRSAAPAAAVVMTAIPVAWDFVLAERMPAGLVLIGIVLGIVAIGFTSYENSGGLASSDRVALPIAIGGGVMFGLLFIVLGEIDADAGGTPVVAQRAVALVVASLAARSTGPRIFPADPVHRRDSAMIGLLATASVVLVVVALQLGGSLSVVSVLTSQYAAVAVIGGVLFRNDRMNRFQAMGLAMASLAVALITLG